MKVKEEGIKMYTWTDRQPKKKKELAELDL